MILDTDALPFPSWKRKKFEGYSQLNCYVVPIPLLSLYVPVIVRLLLVLCF
jgi:hypothetical protein